MLPGCSGSMPMPRKMSGRAMSTIEPSMVAMSMPERRDEQGHPLVAGRQRGRVRRRAGRPGRPGPPAPAAPGPRSSPGGADCSTTAMAPPGRTRSRARSRPSGRGAPTEVNAYVNVSVRRPVTTGGPDTHGRDRPPSPIVRGDEPVPRPRPAAAAGRGAAGCRPASALGLAVLAGCGSSLLGIHVDDRPATTTSTTAGGADRRRPCPSTARWPWPSRWSPAPTRRTAAAPVKSPLGLEPDHPGRPGAHVAGRQGRPSTPTASTPCSGPPAGRARW